MEVTGWVAGGKPPPAAAPCPCRGSRHRRASRRSEGAARVTIRAGADGIRVGDAIAVLARLRPPSGPVMPGGYDFGRADYYAGIGAVGFAYGAARPPILGPPPLGIALRMPLADLRETIRRASLPRCPATPARSPRRW